MYWFLNVPHRVWSKWLWCICLLLLLLYWPPPLPDTALTPALFQTCPTRKGHRVQISFYSHSQQDTLVVMPKSAWTKQVVLNSLSCQMTPVFSATISYRHAFSTQGDGYCDNGACCDVITVFVVKDCRHRGQKFWSLAPSQLGVKKWLCAHFGTNPAVLYPWWCEGNCPAQPWLHRTSPPPKNATCCVCPSPWDSPGPAGFEPCTRQERETHCKPWAAYCLCVCPFVGCLETQPLGSYLLGDAVAEVIFLKVGQLQQWWLWLLQALHYHLGQLHTVFYSYQSRSMESWTGAQFTIFDNIHKMAQLLVIF